MVKSDLQEGKAPRFFSTVGDIYDPLAARLYTLNQETFIPHEIRESIDFKRLFPQQSKALALSNDVYKFTDAHGHVIFVKRENKQLIIEQEREGQWYRFVPPYSLVNEKEVDEEKKVKSALESRYLVDHFHHWRSIADPTKVLLIEQRLDQPKYEILLGDVNARSTSLQLVTRFF